MRSGVVGVNDGRLWYAGYIGYMWSGHSTSASSAYNIRFDSSVNNIVHNDSKYYARPLRCLSTVLGM